MKERCIAVNGKKSSAPLVNGYATIEISDGDEILLDLGIRLVKETVIIGEKTYAGFSFGPIVMVPDSIFLMMIYIPQKIAAASLSETIKRNTTLSLIPIH